ncbi:hypothetical protein SAMN05519104_4335 [Rhizobiales bacterium GAS188]|nr:hypothetical protein SAMN05519104_4335 [Rhizobiales bacterium GAS188]
MAPINAQEAHTLVGASLINLSNDDLAKLKELSDDDLLRTSGSLDGFSIVEASRRLRVALHKEERAIKWLTWWLVVMTVVLVGLTAALVWLGFRTLS